MANTDIRPDVDEEVDDTARAADVSIADTEGLSEKPKSFGKLAWERFLGHRLALVGAIGLVLLVMLF